LDFSENSTAVTMTAVLLYVHNSWIIKQIQEFKHHAMRLNNFVCACSPLLQLFHFDA